MLRYTLRQLEVFAAAARHENLSRAAEELAMSQSAASAALAELEMAHGVRLFDRVGKRLRLNDLGRGLLPVARELLDRAADISRLLAGDTGGKLHVGATLTIGNYLATRIAVDFMQRYPERRLALSVANTAQVVAQVADYVLDLGLVEGYFSHPDLEAIPWGGDRLVVFAAPGHPLAGQSGVGPEDLAGADWIVREVGSGTRDAFDRGVADVLPAVRIRLELEHTEAIKRAVEAGLGIGCLSELALGEAFRRGSLVPIATPFLSFARRFHIALRRDRFRSPAVRDFLDACQESRARGFGLYGSADV